MNTARWVGLSLLVSVGASGPAFGQAGLACLLNGVEQLARPRDARADPYAANDLADGLRRAIELDHSGRVIVVAPPTGKSSTRGISSSTRYCIRLYQGDAEGVVDTGRSFVEGYDVVRVAPVIACAPPETPAAQPGSDPGKTEPAKKDPPKPSPGQPTLDELLGIKPGNPEAPKGEQPKGEAPKGDQPKAEGNDDPSKADLNRKLTGKELSDAFQQAVALMGDASARLTKQQDPGLDTQRVQEDAIKRLDQLISSMQKNQQQQQQSSSSSQQNQDSKQSPNQRQQQKKPGQSSEQPKQGDGMTDHAGPTLQEGKLNPQLESARAAWGSLPARIRDMLMQGTEDRFSARYKQLTQEYYKRLAEENSK